MSTRCVSISDLIDLQVRRVSFSSSDLRFSRHLALKVLLRKDSSNPCSGPILATLVGGPPGRKINENGWSDPA